VRGGAVDAEAAKLALMGLVPASSRAPTRGAPAAPGEPEPEGLLINKRQWCHLPWQGPLITVIPAKAGIQFPSLWKGGRQAWDSRLRGNDRAFKGGFVPNDPTTFEIARFPKQAS